MTPDEVNRLSDLVYDTAPLPGPDGVQQPDFRHFMVCAANDPLNKSNWEEDWLNYRIERSRSAVIHAARELHKNGM
ncbi:MAG: hypothetical protein HY291_12820, partial [Planctomycetes bacterium]|nr:hypothetical protein [Planctomycetota bacterium]